VYCVKSEALNLVVMSTTFVCTTQTCAEKSTAKHVDDSKHTFRHLDSKVYGYNIPFDDATPSSIVHSSHSAIQTHNTYNIANMN